MKKAYLVLENGTVFEGYRFGADSESIGELVFNTGMVGYIETLTDPSYSGQIVLQTFPLAGNYGIIEEDFGGKCCVKGLVVREWCDTPSNFRSQYDLDTFLKNQGVPGIWGVDTREITKTIRENGVMNAKICDAIPEELTDIQGYKIVNAIQALTVSEPEVFPAEGEEKFRVTMIDYGSRLNIVSELTKRGCAVTAVPCTMSAGDILADDPDGIVLSNGPGDPADNTGEIAEIKKLMGKKPIFGVCLGHQLLALANGAKTEKLKYGHRGANQPVKDLNGISTYITSQNHGYVVVSDSVKNGKISFMNVNDSTCEGIDYPDKNAFSVQFYPTAGGGPLDTDFLFSRFVEMMGGKN